MAEKSAIFLCTFASFYGIIITGSAINIIVKGGYL